MRRYFCTAVCRFPLVLKRSRACLSDEHTFDPRFQHKGIMSQINVATGLVETRLKVQHYADSLTNKDEYPVRAMARRRDERRDGG